MSKITLPQKDQKEIDRLRTLIKNSYDENKNNRERFEKFRKMIFRNTLSSTVQSTNNSLDLPNLQFNLGEAYASRITGELSSADPFIAVSVDDRTKPTELLVKMTEVLEGHLRYVFSQAKKDGTLYDIIMDIVSGGYAVGKVYTDYAHPHTFNQTIRFKKVYYSPMCVFDQLAQSVTKEDGELCCELFPMWREEFEEKYDIKLEDGSFKGSKAKDEGFKWFFKHKDREVVVIADVYKKKKKSFKLVKLTDGREMTKEKFEEELESGNRNPMDLTPEIKFEDDRVDDLIVRYQLYGGGLIEKPKETDLPGLPHVFFQCNSVVLGEIEHGTEQMDRPYLYQIEGAQKLFDNIGITLASECQRLNQTKMVIFSESINENWKDTITNPQQYEYLVVDGYDENGRPLPPPFQIQRQAFPPEMFALFQFIPTLMQNIIGAFDSDMGMAKNNAASGEAIIQSMIHSTASSKPLVSRYIQGLNRVAELIIGLIPKYFVTPMSLPIIDKDGKNDFVRINDDQDQNSISLQYDPKDFHIKIEAGASFAVQKSQAIGYLERLTKSIPGFADMISQKGLPVIMDNIECRGADRLKVLSEQYQQELAQKMQQQAQMQQQALMMNPQIIHEQREAKKDMMEAQLDSKRLEMEQQQLAIERAKLHLESIDMGHRHALETSQHKHGKMMDHKSVEQKDIEGSHKRTMAEGELGHKVLQTVSQQVSHEKEKKSLKKSK